jgi:hypothetical protein
VLEKNKEMAIKVDKLHVLIYDEPGIHAAGSDEHIIINCDALTMLLRQRDQ